MALHHPEILLHLVLAIEIYSLTSATFFPFPAGRPADPLPCALRVTATWLERRGYQPNSPVGGARTEGNRPSGSGPAFSFRWVRIF